MNLLTAKSLLHSEHIVEIEKLVVGGAGLGRIEGPDGGLVIFIPLAAPGEKLKAKVIQVEKNHIIGEIVEIIEPSPSRREAPCEYFKACGGCSWQHITEAEQVRQKEQILIGLLSKALKSIAPLEKIESKLELWPTITSEKSFNYRNRIQLKQQGTKLGYFKKASNQIVDISSCAIAASEISVEIQKVKARLKPSPGLKKFELKINQLNQLEFYEIGSSGEGLSFSQVNNSVNENLIKEVVALVGQIKPRFLSELYAGDGNFTFPLLAALPDIVIESVELNSKLTASATKKLTAQQLQKRLFAFTSDCESFVERRPLSQEFVLLDPPRTGCSDKVLSKIISCGAKNILYLSCHPAFLVRDLKEIMTSQPEYKISRLQIFDMFPQTDHFETLVLLGRT